MGCHTWFMNKIADMPQEHLDKLRENTIKDIKSAYIYKESAANWFANAENELKWFEEENDMTNLSDSDKAYYGVLVKMADRKYYKKARGKYVRDLRTLQNPKSTRLQILKAIARHDILFDKDLNNGSYEMSDVGWHDNYRVSGYPTVTHHNAEEAIKFLEEYDNGNNIQYDYTKGMCNEIRDIITKFFNEFPNGTIHYG